MKKVYILTYTNKTFFSLKKRHSGIDSSALTQFLILKELGYDVRMFHAQGELDQHFDGIDYYINYKTDNPKVYEKQNRTKIQEKLLQSIIDFKPNLIISNFEFSSFYSKLMNLDIPIAYVLHAMPGSWNDLSNANLLNDMVTSGHTFSCVSEYHKKSTMRYYSSGRADWTFDKIIPDFVFFPQYCDTEKIQNPTKTVKHCSAASKGKDTFLIHQFLEGSDYPTEVYTTLAYLGIKNDDPYITDSMAKYSDRTFLDVDHSEIMNQIATASVVFVGNYPDTFTITSLEALSRGVPLIVKEKMGGHPATEMVEPEFLKYVALIKNKKEFTQKVKQFIDIPIEERKLLAESVTRKMGKDSYKKLISSVVDNTITKYKNTHKVSKLEGFFI